MKLCIYPCAGLYISRTVILPEFSDLLFPSASCLPLKSVGLVNTGMQRESHPHLATAMKRPTAIGPSKGSGSSTMHFLPPSAPAKSLNAGGQNSTVGLARRTVKVSELGAVFQSPIAAAASAAAAAEAAARAEAAMVLASPSSIARPLGPNWWLTLQEVSGGLQLLTPCPNLTLARV